MENSELEKTLPHIITGVTGYVTNTVVCKTILKKSTGHVVVYSFGVGALLTEKSIPFDMYIQVIDGSADLTIHKTNYTLRLGEGFIIPAHTLHKFHAREQFKMISTVIKSGYEEAI